MRRMAAIIAVSLLLAVFPLTPASAAPPWDETFAGTGIAQAGFELTDWLVRPDGSFVLIGLGWDETIGEQVWMVAGYTAQGLPDPAFAGGEPVIAGISQANFPRPLGALRSDGGLVVTDYSHAGYELVALNRDGTLDTNFGGDGSVLFSGPDRGLIDEASSASGYLFLDDLAFQQSGRLVIHGWMNESGPWLVGGGLESSTFLLGLTPQGDPDPAFGTEGVTLTGVTPYVPTGGWVTRIDDIGVEPDQMHVASDDSISIAGGQLSTYAQGPTVVPDVVARFTADGSPLTSFGVAGHAPYNHAPSTASDSPGEASGWSGTTSVATDAVGGVWVSGAFLGTQQTTRLDANGIQDLSFTDDAWGAGLRPLPEGGMLAVQAHSVRILGADGSLVEEVDLSTVPGAVRSIDAVRLQDGSYLLLLASGDRWQPFGVGRLGIATQEPTEITLSATPVRDRGAQVVDLVWSGTAAPVDVLRDGAVVATALTGGSHRDETGGRGRTSYVYRVCLSDDPSVCSSEVTASFPDQP